MQHQHPIHSLPISFDEHPGTIRTQRLAFVTAPIHVTLQMTRVSVYLSLPPKGASPFRLAVLRFGAMFATILGPELTLWWATTERRQARFFQKTMAEKCTHHYG